MLVLGSLNGGGSVVLSGEEDAESGLSSSVGVDGSSLSSETGLVELVGSNVESSLGPLVFGSGVESIKEGSNV